MAAVALVVSNMAEAVASITEGEPCVVITAPLSKYAKWRNNEILVANAPAALTAEPPPAPEMAATSKLLGLGASTRTDMLLAVTSTFPDR